MDKNQVQQPKQQVSEKLGRVLLVTVGTTVMASPAFAAGEGFDVSTIVTLISGFIAGVSALGLSVLSLVVTGKVFKWVRTAI